MCINCTGLPSRAACSLKGDRFTGRCRVAAEMVQNSGYTRSSQRRFVCFFVWCQNACSSSTDGVGDNTGPDHITASIHPAQRPFGLNNKLLHCKQQFTHTITPLGPMSRAGQPLPVLDPARLQTRCMNAHPRADLLPPLCKLGPHMHDNLGVCCWRRLRNLGPQPHRNLCIRGWTAPSRGAHRRLGDGQRPGGAAAGGAEAAPVAEQCMLVRDVLRRGGQGAVGCVAV